MPTPRRRTILFLLAALTTGAAACKTDSKEESPNQTAHANDSATTQTSYTTPAAGVAGVTKTDARAVTASTEYELTADNFAKFMKANENLQALAARDAQARTFLSQSAAEGGSTDLDAGVKRLLAQPAVANAIQSAGISVTDYFVAGIAIASARKFIPDPKAAPPTPATPKNAEFLRAHQADLTRLDQLQASTLGGRATTPGTTGGGTTNTGATGPR